MNLSSVKPSFKEFLETNGKKQGTLIPILQAAQDEYSYIPEEVVVEIAKVTGRSVSDIWSVVTFYKQFRLTPMGKYCIKICDGTACHVKGSSALIDIVRTKLNLTPVKSTTDDMLFTLETVSCLGACGLAPVMLINKDVHGQMTKEQVEKIIDDIIIHERIK